MFDALIVGAVKAVLRSRARGTTRLTLWLAGGLPALQSVPVTVEGAPLYLDLRITNAHGYLSDYDSEADERAVVRRLVKPGDVVLDIGAHLGLYTVLFAKLVKNGTVFAFEPNPLVLPSLEKTVAALSNVRLQRLAIADADKTETLYVPGDQSMVSLRDWTKNLHGAVNKHECETRTLDELLAKQIIRQPDFIKCDVEGGELDCFRGARWLLDRVDAPLVMFESNPNTARGYNLENSAAMNFLASLGRPQYGFYLIEAAGALRRIERLESFAANVVAAPASKQSLVAPLMRA